MVKARGEFTVAPLSDGSDGRGVVSVTTYFLATSLSTGVTTKTSGWGTALQPLTATKRYLWEYTVTAYDSGSPTTTIPVIKGVYGDKGDDGVSITSMVEEYYHSTSPTTQTGGSWSTIVPDWAGDKYLWLRIKTVYSNSTVTHTKAMNVTGQKGETGSQGKDKFLWIKYADDEKGSGMSDSGIDKKYIGVSPNQLSEKESDNPSDYKWSPMYDLGALDDITLADKTEILSGTEIYTDKADDAVVHVNIDGNSYQHAGSGKNLLRNNMVQRTSGTTLDYDERTHIYTLTYENSSPTHSGLRTNGVNVPPLQRINMSMMMMANKDALISVDYNNSADGVSGNDNQSENGSTSVNLKKNEWQYVEFYYVSSLSVESREHSLFFAHSSDRDGLIIQFKNIQYELGDSSTPYEPPAPTPDYPIEIESLNDFDVVSSKTPRNMFKNSDFSKETDGWLGNTSYINDGMWNKDISGGVSFGELYQVFNVIEGHIYYGGFFSESKATHQLTLAVDIKTSGNYPSNFFIGYANPLNGLRSGTYVFSETKETEIGLKQQNHPNTEYTKAYNFFLIDLTDFYGKGKEPSKEKMDEVILNLSKVESPEDITESDNHPTIDKVNLSLSEPLRSVGDVKDRLFRDSDGLWKVERRVKEFEINGTEQWMDWVSDSLTHNSYYLKLPDIARQNSISSHFQHNYGAGRHSSITGINVYGGASTTFNLGIPRTLVNSIEEWKVWLKSNPVIFIAELVSFHIETLPQADQDKLNNIASYRDSNYLYTIVDKTNILPEYVRENLKPNLHATFKSKGWYRNFKTDTNVVDSQANKFKMAQQEKKVLDERYKELYAHSKLSGNVKTALYNAKVAYNTVFMALEISLHHYILEKTESRLSELEAVYSGGNGYVSAKAILEVALDNAQSNITEGVTNDKTGRNRWIGKKYTWTDTVRIAPKLSHIRGLEPVETVAIDDTKRFTFNDDKYLAHFFTYLYLDKAKTITTTVAHDDSFTLVVNGQEVISTNATIPAPYAVSIPLSKGWNQIDMLLQEFTGGDHITLGHELSTLVDDMSCYLGGGFSASQIRQLSDEIDIRVQKGDVINAINVSTEGIRLEGKKVSIDGKTEFKEDLVMKSGVIQSADGGTRLDLNKNTFTFDKPFTIGKSQVATDKDVKDSIDGIEIGGRNLIRNSNNFTNFGGYYGAKSTFEEGVHVPEWGAYDATRIVISGGSSALKTTPQIYATVDSQVNYSFWAKNMGTKDISFKFNGLNGASEIALAVDESKRISVFGKMRATIDWFQHQIYTHFSEDSVDIILWRSKLEYGNKATDYTVAPEDTDLAISEAQKSAEAVAVAKANLAEVNAKAHADGVLDKEEKARIAQAQANLGKAMAEAKKKADEAERLAKLYADEQVDGIQIGGRNLLLNSGERIVGSRYDLTTYDISEDIKEGEQLTISLKGELGDGKTSWGIYNSGGSVSPVTLKPEDLRNGIYTKTFNWRIGGTTNKFIRVYHMASETRVDSEIEWIKLERGNKVTDYTPAPEDVDTAINEAKKSAEAVAVAKANLAEVNAKAHADGVLDKEEKARIAQAQTNLNTAMAEAKKKADEAERLAKLHADTKANKALADAKLDATAKADEAKRSAEALAVAKANLAEINAKAHADGVLDKEEKARIAQAQTNLNTAMAVAKKKADEAERLAKLHADKQVGDIEIGGRNYFSPRLINNLAMSNTISSSLDYRGFYKQVESGEVYSISRENMLNNRFRICFTKEKPVSGLDYYNPTMADDKLKIEGIIVPPEMKYIFLYLSNNNDEISKIKIEKGNKATDWTPAPEDTDLAISEAQKSAEAVAVAKANLAEVNAKAHADGKVTAEEKRAIADAQAKLDEAKKYVDDMEVGGRNLILGSGTPVESSAYMVAEYFISEDFVQGQEYIATIKGTKSSNVDFGIWQNTSSSGRGNFKQVKDGIYQLRFTSVATTAGNERRIRIYQPPSESASEATIEWIKLEKGNKATDYTLAPEDVDLAIDNKSDKETTDGLEKALEDLNDVVADIGVDGIREQLVEYQSVLNDVGNDSKNAKDRLEKLLDPTNGELKALTVALNELSQRWKTQDGFIQINGDETELSITKGDVSMILGSDGLIFYSGGEAVATINGQYLRIDRGIFAESLHVGRHQWSPLASNRDHFVLSYTTDVRDV